ncbi:MAG: hypothetical protein IJL93_08650 [Bacteroidales bacterium]|nr:hypothetical protein [Bacteroidales bacterium]
MKRLLFAALVLILSFAVVQAQEKTGNKSVESNLMFNSGVFFETGSCPMNVGPGDWLWGNGSSALLMPGHVFRLSYGLDFRLGGDWSLMPGAGLRVQTASLLGMFAIGGDVDVMAAADAFCALRYHLDAGKTRIIFGLGPDVSWLASYGYYIDADPSDPRNDLPKFHRVDYGLQPGITFRMGKHWQWGLEANFGLRNMRIPYENLEYHPYGNPDETARVSVKGSTHLHTIALTCGFHF